MAAGGMASHRLFVMHIEEGTEAGTDAWQHNPDAQVSSHFGNPKAADAPLDQFVDTNDRAWAEAAYNNVAISVEHEGNTGDSLTAAQLERDAQLLAWCHTTHGTPLQVTTDPNGSGVIGHGQLGVAGGNHPDCPGQPIVDQFPAVVARAKAILNLTPSAPKEIDMILHSITGSSEVWSLSGSLYWHVADPQSLSSYRAAGVPEATITQAEHASILAAIAAQAAVPTTITGSIPLTISGTGTASVHS
jgi:hypothetical protein